MICNVQYGTPVGSILYLLPQEAAQLPDSKVDASFADELFAKVIGLPESQQEEGYVAPHTQLQVSTISFCQL